MIYLYFFIGQAVAFNFAHYAVSLITLVFCHIIVWLATGIDELYLGLAFYAGWLSVVLIPELFLQVQDIITRIFHLKKHIDFTFYILILELFIFILITLFIKDFEYSTIHWVYLLVVHAIYNFILAIFGSTLPLDASDKTQPRKYYVSWFYIVLLTDLVFLIISFVELSSLSTHLALMYTYSTILFVFQGLIKIMEKLNTK